MTVIKLSSVIGSIKQAEELFFKWKKDTPDLFIVVKEVKRPDRTYCDHQYFVCRPIRSGDTVDLDRGREGNEASLYIEMKEGMSKIYPEEVKKKPSK